MIEPSTQLSVAVLELQWSRQVFMAEWGFGCLPDYLMVGFASMEPPSFHGGSQHIANANLRLPWFIFFTTPLRTFFLACHPHFVVYSTSKHIPLPELVITMSRKRLATNEMLYLSAEWLKSDSPAHHAILASTDLAPTLPRLQTAHQDLANAAQPTAINPRLTQIIKEQSDIDDRHDDIVRGVHGLLTSTAALLGGSEATHLLALRDQLIPDGLATVQKSYGAEAGEATQLATRITPEIRSQLDKILVGTNSAEKRLGSFLDEWILLGEKLGALEIEKARLNPDANATTGTQLVTARNKWLRTINLFLAVAEAAELPHDTDRLIFGPLRAAEAKADRRGRVTELTKGDASEHSPIAQNE